MEWLIAVGIIFWLILRTSGLKDRLNELVKQLCEHDKRLKHIERHIGTGSHAESPTMVPAILPEATSPFGQPTVSEPVAPSVRAPVAESSPESIPRGIKAVAEELPPPRTPVTPSPLEEHLRRFEHMFIENWTGILGTVVVVAGVTFIGIYTALRLPPFYRFLMMVGAAVALGAASTFLRRRESWWPLAEWVRSAAAAIFMFACAASGGLPGLGMQWIEASTPALELLLLVRKLDGHTYRSGVLEDCAERSQRIVGRLGLAFAYRTCRKGVAEKTYVTVDVPVTPGLVPEEHNVQTQVRNRKAGHMFGLNHLCYPGQLGYISGIGSEDAPLTMQVLALKAIGFSQRLSLSNVFDVI